MNEVITNAIGGIIILFLVLAQLGIMMMCRKIARWQLWTFRVTCYTAALATIVHLVQLMY